MRGESDFSRITWPYVLWIFLLVVLLTAFITWNPPIRFAVSRFWPLIVAATFLLSYAGWGSVPGLFLTQGKCRSIQFLTSAAAGMGATGLMMMVLGTSGNLRPGLLVLWIIGGVALSVRLIHKLRPFSLHGRIRGFWDILAVAVLVAFVLLHLPYVLAPEVSSDALSYHLLVPKMYLGMGKVDRLPFLVESNYPLLAEFCYLPLLAVSGEIACKGLHFLVGLLLLWTMAQFVRKIRGENSGLIASALFLSMPAVVVQTGWAWNDFFYTFFLLLSLYFLYHYHVASGRDRDSKDLSSAGMLAGLAAATKYSFGLFFVSLIFISLLGVRRWGWNKKDLWKVFLPAVVLPGAWFLKNWIYTGNPVFPLLHGLFESPYWSDSLADFHQRSISRSYIGDFSWHTYLLFPFQMVLNPRVADIHVGVLPLVMIPLLPGLKFKGRSFFIAFLLAMFVSWLFFQTGIRTVFIFFAVLMMLYSISLYCRFSEKSWKRAIIVMILSVGLVMNLFLTFLNTYHVFDPFPYFIGRESEEDYLLRVSPSQRAYDYLNSRSEIGNVLLVSLHAPLYLRQLCFFSGRHDQPMAEVVASAAGSKEEMVARLRSMNVSHVAINVDAYQVEHEEGLYQWDEFRRKAFEELLKERCKQAGRWEQDVVLECRFSGP